MGEAAPDLGAVEQGVGDVVGAGDLDGAAEEACRAVARCAVTAADDDAAVLEEEGFAGFGLEFAPDGVGALHEGDVGFAFGDGEAGDAGFAVGRALVMRGVQAVDADGADAAKGQSVQRCSAHGAEPDHDDVGGVHPCHGG